MFNNFFKNPKNIYTAEILAEGQRERSSPEYFLIELPERMKQEAVIEEKEKLVKDAIETLTPRQRECLILYAVYEQSQQIIADLLGINQRVVSQHIQYGKRKIRKYFQKYFM